MYATVVLLLIKKTQVLAPQPFEIVVKFKTNCFHLDLVDVTSHPFFDAFDAILTSGPGIVNVVPTRVSGLLLERRYVTSLCERLIQ